MAIIWTAENQETKRCFKLYRFGQYLGTHILTGEQVKDFRQLPGYEVRPSYWIESAEVR